MPQAEINLAAITHNLARLKTYLQPQTQVLAAVKANAYGHGSIAVSRHLIQQGVRWLGVATSPEALELRQAGITSNILIFSPVFENISELIEQDIALTITDAHSLELANRAAQASSKIAKVHLKVDTGMGRLGLSRPEAVNLAQAIDRSRHLELEAVWTHFACADDDSDFTVRQIAAFDDFLAELDNNKIAVPLKHAANSAAIIAYPESQFNLVRPGIGLYGYHSSDFIASLESQLIPAMTLSAPITFIKRVKAGTTISYGASWRAKQQTTIATVRFGYADGYPRLLSNRAQVLVRGQRKPLVGKVCMDQLMVDLGDMDLNVGERVTLFGPTGPTAEDLARLCGTIAYEILTNVSERVARAFRQ